VGGSNGRIQRFRGALLKEKIRIGFGYDIHRFAENRKLVLGGVEIPSEKGLSGHSDADALLHAITDAILGALSLGDIGKHFPDTDSANKNRASKEFLEYAYNLVLEKGYELANMDATVVTEKPKLRPFIPEIEKSISEILNVDREKISVKATTSEKMGFVGRGEGLKAYAVVLLQLKGNE